MEIGLAGEEDKDIFEVEEAELFLEDLEEDTDYELRIGLECGEDFIAWSKIILFTTDMEELISNTDEAVLKRTIAKVNLFPNPTTGSMTLRIKSPQKDILNYSISTIDGRVLSRNISKISACSSDLKIDVNTLPEGIYMFNGVTINSRENISTKIVKIGQ